METIKITNPPKSWWAGDPRVEPFMGPVSEAIRRHIKWPSEEYTDIYNRAYEAVYKAIVEHADRKESNSPKRRRGK